MNIYDSNDKQVGNFLSIESAPFSESADTGKRAWVQFKDHNKTYILPVYRDGIGDYAAGMPIFYSTNDCSGQGYITAYVGEHPVIFEEWTFTESGLILLNSPYLVPQNRSFATYKTPPDTTCRIVNDPSAEYLSLPLTVGPNFRAGFTPPFRLE
jgi:hypothetical protein